MFPVSHSKTTGLWSALLRTASNFPGFGVTPRSTETSLSHPLFVRRLISPSLIGFTPLPSPRFFPLCGWIVNRLLPLGQTTALIPTSRSAWIFCHVPDSANGPLRARATIWTIFILLPSPDLHGPRAVLEPFPA